MQQIAENHPQSMKANDIDFMIQYIYGICLIFTDRCIHYFPRNLRFPFTKLKRLGCGTSFYRISSN